LHYLNLNLKRKGNNMYGKKPMKKATKKKPMKKKYQWLKVSHITYLAVNSTQVRLINIMAN